MAARPDAASRVVLITGASSGIGKACAEHLRDLGHRVYGTSRTAGLPDAPSQDGMTLLPLDVCCETSVARAVEWIMRHEGRIDVVINNAGHGIAGAVEDTSIAEAQAQFDSNFFGMLRVCRGVLPILREQASGYLINIGSIAGRIAVPFQGLYSASKFAVEGLSEALRHELKPHGVQVVLVEPGDFRTGFTAQRTIADAAKASNAYAGAFNAALGVMEQDERGGETPEAIARLVARIIASPAPKLRHTVGPALQRLSVSVLKPVLPQAVFERLIARYYRVL